MTTSTTVSSGVAGSPVVLPPVKGTASSCPGWSAGSGDVTALGGLDLTLAPGGDGRPARTVRGVARRRALRVLAGFERPDQGTVTVSGVDITHQPPNKRGMGMVFQAFSLFPNLTVADNVSFGLRVRGAFQHRPPDPGERTAGDRRTVLHRRPLSAPALRWPAAAGGLAGAGGGTSGAAARRTIVRIGRTKSGPSCATKIRRLQQRLHITTLFVAGRGRGAERRRRGRCHAGWPVGADRQPG